MSLKKSALIAIALLAVAFFVTGLASGQGTKKRKRSGPPVNTSAQTPHPSNANAAAPTANGNTPDTFTGGSDDGQSIKR